MKIAIASLGDPSSVATWSGIPSTIVAGLRSRGHEVVPIALEKPNEPWHFNWRRRFHHRIEGKWFLGSVERSWLQKISRQLDDAVARIDPRVVLVIHADWLAYSTFECPACIIHDTTFDSIVDYYPTFTNLSVRSPRKGHEMYQRALDKCVAAVYSAEWATRSAMERYKLPVSKAFTIPFGANIERSPDEALVGRWISERVKSDVCHFLFIGTQWKRKGGPLVLQFVSELNKLGVRARVTLVGCTGEVPDDLKAFVNQVGYLKKDQPSDLAQLNELFAQCHGLIVLSEAECYGCVFCEANAYGLPAIGRATGGIPEIIREGRNGLLLMQHETVRDLAKKWARIWRDRTEYEQMCRNAHSEFSVRLNGGAFANRLDEILSDVLPNHN